MRLVVAALCLGFATAASAQPPGQNEVLLEVNAAGTVTTRADLATFRLDIEAHGDSADEARRQLAERIRRVTEAAASAGIAPADIEADPVRIETLSRFDNDAVDAAMADLQSTTDAAANRGRRARAHGVVPPPPLQNRSAGADARSALVIRLRDVSRDQAVGNAFAAIQNVLDLPISAPVYALADPRAPRNEARVRALAAARAEAEDYAAALGLRVARMIRVTDRVGPDSLSVMLTESGRQAAATLRDSNGPNVVTVMPIGVDFVLAPR